MIGISHLPHTDPGVMTIWDPRIIHILVETLMNFKSVFSKPFVNISFTFVPFNILYIFHSSLLSHTLFHSILTIQSIQHYKRFNINMQTYLRSSSKINFWKKRKCLSEKRGNQKWFRWENWQMKLWFPMIRYIRGTNRLPLNKLNTNYKKSLQ